MIEKFDHKKTYMGRLEKGDELLNELTRIVMEKEITTGIIKVIGAVQSAKIGYYDQVDEKYKYNEFEKGMEIVSCLANVSILEGEPFVHAHIILADEEGHCYGGHLAEGTIVYASEFFIQTLDGNTLVRTFEKNTNLNLWQSK